MFKSQAAGPPGAAGSVTAPLLRPAARLRPRTRAESRKRWCGKYIRFCKLRDNDNHNNHRNQAEDPGSLRNYLAKLTLRTLQYTRKHRRPIHKPDQQEPVGNGSRLGPQVKA